MARLALLALALLLVGQCKAEGLFDDGQEYQFNYLAHTDTGIREPEAFGSSFGIKGKVIVQKNEGEAIVKIVGAKLGMHNGADSLRNSMGSLKKRELSVLEKPFKVSYTNGKISGFDADSTDPEWSINIKKGLATTLQVDHTTGEDFGKDENAFIRTEEDTVTGNCKTTYTFGSADNGRIALIKQRSMADCANAPRLSRNTYDSTNCKGKLQDELLATTQAYYQLSRESSGNLKPYIIGSLGYQVLQWHPPAGAAMYNLANTTLTLSEAGPITKKITGDFNKHYETLRYTAPRPIPSMEEIELEKEEDYFHPEEPKPQNVLVEQAVELLKQIVQVIEMKALDEKALLDPTVMKATHTFSYLNFESLMTVYSSVKDNKQLRDLFVEVLPLSGSNPAALMIKKLVLENTLSAFQTRRAVAYMPFYLRLPNEKLLTSFEELLKTDKIQNKKLRSAIALSFSHLVGLTCGNKARPCKADTVSKYSRMALEAFKNAETHTEQMVTLMALSNTKLTSAIESLIPYTKSGVVSHVLRPHVIYALYPLGFTNRDKFLAAVMPIFLNKAESTEVRVSAIATIFNANPTFLELQQLIAGALWETNLEVRNFILTTFKNYAQTKNPCMKDMAPKMQLLLRRVAHIETSHFRSNNRVFDYHDEKYGFGGGLQLATIYGEESRAPLILAGRVNYRVSEWGFTPLEVIVRLEGVEDAFVRMFRKLDPQDFKMDTLKDLLQKVMKIAPRQQQPLKMEVIVRSQGYNLLYRHAGMEEIMGLLSSDLVGKLMANAEKMTRDMILLGGQHTSWRSNDLGLPVGVGLSNPGLAHFEREKDGATKIHADVILQVQTHMVAYNPLGVSQGVMKMRGSRLHVPINAQFGYANKQVGLKLGTPTKDEPLSLTFKSETVAFMWGKDSKKAATYLKESCPKCEPIALVTRGEQFRGGRVLRDRENERLGLESHVEVYNCESYTGKSSLSKVLIESFKPSEINSHGSVPGFALMGLMQLRNYFYYYPPTATCSMKAVMHRSDAHPAESVQIQLKMSPEPTKESGLRTSKVEGSVTFLGDVERKWNIAVTGKSNRLNTDTDVSVKIMRQAVPTLSLASRALCVDVKTKWADIPEDVMETPSAVEPSVEREVSFVWGEADANECPKANAEGVSTLAIKINGEITEEQRKAADSRDRYPYNQCDKDMKADGRTGVVVPLTKACMDAVMEYGTPRSYIFDVHYNNLSPLGMKALNRMDTLLKAGLAPYWDMHAPHGKLPHEVETDHNSGHIEMKIEFNEKSANLHVHTDKMHSHYEDVEILKNLQYYMRNARIAGSRLLTYKTGLVGVCTVAPESVVTYDNVTLKYDCPTCYTLVSADCSAQPRFAVFAKKTDKDLPLAVKIYAGGHHMEFKPTSSGIQVRAGGKVVTIPENGEEYSFEEGVIKYFVVKKMGARYFIEVPMLRLKFRYTGDDLSSMIPSTHRAQHCGMCGDFNGQYVNEMTGPSGCTMKNANDLAKSYVLRDKFCKETIPVPSCQSYNTERTSSGIVGFLGQFSGLKN